MAVVAPSMFEEVAKWVGLVGGACGIALAIFQGWEFLRARRKPQASGSFTSDPNFGNEVYVTNLSSTPMIVDYWTLEWARRRWWGGRQVVDTIEPDPPFGGKFLIAPHSRYEMEFADADHFDWGYKARPGQKLYIKLHVAGRRRPVVLKVYDPAR